ncbi:histidine kinase [Jiulongibacter sediminis]|jgi:signal transduction histidine kinase|uniref:ATP-binding protein n=1 Tax=Jiulongibacter sediminis TaxID=1605367 RepID=UPI0026EF48CF|nr:histidine kinase [Jiulongibacter sediminis]
MVIFSAIFTFLFTQPVQIQARALRSSVTIEQDSVYIQGLDNRLQFEFKIDSLESFQYRLEGFDEDLTPHESQYPIAVYTNLPGGKFEFQYWINEKAQSPIKVSVMEAIWQKWWFWPMIGGYILLLGGIGTFLFFQYNYRQKLKVEYLRNKIAADLHDEVGSNLSSISIYTQVLRKKLGQNNPDLIPLLDKITGNSKESVSLMQDTVWTLNPTNDTTEMLIQRIVSFGKEVLPESGVSFDQQIEVNTYKIKLDMEGRKSCYLIMKEAVNNAAKYAEATKVSFSIYPENGRIVFEIKDNGKGFDTSNKTEGNGIKNFYQRATESGFEVQINSSPGIGTSVKLLV